MNDQTSLAPTPPISTQSGGHQFSELFNATPAAYPQDKLIQELFEEQVARTPEATALIYEQQSLTYAELNRQANQLGSYLRGKGIGPDQLVGICVERSLEMVIGLLGILKAGGAYVPLDPNYPTERLQYMLKDAAPQVVLMQDKVKARLPSMQQGMVALDAVLRGIEGCSDASVSIERRPTARNLVYVIYTSGSTGRPKGTAMAHRSMVNLIEWHRHNFCVGGGQRVLQFAALSFDVAFQETFSTLCDGGTLVLLDEWVRRDARALMELLHSQRIERLFLPPLMLQSLAECFRTTHAVPSRLRDIIVAGEQLRISPEIVDFFKHLAGCRLHNHYGPTETHVVTALTLAGNPERWPALPTIGRPISNTQIYVLDERRRPVSPDAIGEIYIGGANVARGYLHRPELTEERFLPDPFSTNPQARMYKTGDLGRWLPDGTIEYLGRNDDQVKIRGFRIELGEIEVQLSRHAQIRESAVVAREDIPGEKRIVAYVTQREGSCPSVEELRAHLAALLPEHMIPSAFVPLDSLPLTPSGKLNRRALPAPGPEAYASRQYEPPQGAVEKALAKIWQELLGVEQVGRQDNFFKLGGNSVTSLRLIVKIVEVFATHLSAVSVFQYPSLQEMAQVVAMPRSDGPQPGLSSRMDIEDGAIATPPASRETAPLTVQQEMMWHALQRGGQSYLHPCVLRIVGPVNPELMRRSFEEIVRRHDSLRTRIKLVDGVPRQEIDAPCAYRLKVVNLSDASRSDIDAKVQNAIDEVTHQGCDMATGPLFETRLIQLSEREHLLVWSVHHIVSDGFSSSLIFREFWLAYSEFVQGRPLPLRNAAMQYADYAHWQRQVRLPWLQKSDSYWEERLRGAVGIQWPVEGIACDMRCDAYEKVQIEFGISLSNALRELASLAGTTVGMAILTVYVAVVSRWCKQRDFIVATSTTGRDLPELEGLTGFCAHDLYLRIQLTSDETLMSLLGRVSQEFYEALSHQDFGSAMARTPDLLAHTLFQWMPWQLSEHDGAPEPDVSAKLGIVVERLPVKVVLKKESPFSQYSMMPVFWDTDKGVVGAVYCRACVVSTVELFARDLRSTAEQLAKNAYVRVVGYA